MSKAMVIVLPRWVGRNRSEASMSRGEKRVLGRGAGKRARNTSKAHNKSERRAVRRILRTRKF